MTDVFPVYDPPWKLLAPEAKRMVLFEDRERLFDKARRDMRAWKKAHVERVPSRAPVPA